MAFCTLVEWDGDFDNALIDGAGGHDNLPAGCLSRIVGATADEARVIEVRQSSDDARKFGEEHGPAIAEFELRRPDRVAPLATTFYLAR